MRNRLKELLKPKVTYKEIAERYGCTIGFVSHIAEGKRKPPARFKVLVSEMLNLPIPYIFPEDNDERSQ